MRGSCLVVEIGTEFIGAMGSWTVVGGIVSDWIGMKLGISAADVDAWFDESGFWNEELSACSSPEEACLTMPILGGVICGNRYNLHQLIRPDPSIWPTPDLVDAPFLPSKSG